MSKVLIIEDEVAIADLEKDYLELSGFEVETENDVQRSETSPAAVFSHFSYRYKVNPRVHFSLIYIP